MTNKLVKTGRSVANKIVAVQVLLAIISTLMFLWVDFKAAYSAFTGGIICVVPNLVFVTYAYRYGGARAAKKIAGSFYRGEALKIMLTALGFAVAFTIIPVSFGPLMTTYVLCLMAFWATPFLHE